MKFELTFGDLNGTDQDRTDAINEAIQMAHNSPRHTTLVLPEGRIEVAEGLQYYVTGDVSAELSIQGAGGDSWGTILRGNGPVGAPTIKIGTDGGGNFRRCPIEGITFQRRGIEFENVGYGVLRDVGFHGIVGPSIISDNSFLRFNDCIAQHSDQLVRSSGGSLRFTACKLGEDLGGLRLLGTQLYMVGCEGHSFKTSAELTHDTNGVAYGVKPWILALSGALVRIDGGCALSMSPNSSEPTPENEVCDTFILTDRTRDIAFGGSDLHMGKAKSFITTRFQNSGTEPGATFVVGDDVIITSDLDAGQKFTVFDSLYNGAGTGFDKPRFNGTVEVRDTTEVGFAWSDGVADAQGLDTSRAQVGLNTD